MHKKAIRRVFSSCSKAAKPLTPDFTTKVNVAEHKLKDFGSWINTSLVEESIRDMEERTEITMEEVDMTGMSLEERKKHRRDLKLMDIPDFWTTVEDKGKQLTRKPVEIFQLNIGLYCNQSCTHCHVESSPKRMEQMDREVLGRCLHLIRTGLDSIHTVDITGGAPELMTHFRWFVQEVRKISPTLKIIDRCNLTVLSEPGQEDLAEFLYDNNVTVIASLPCYSRKNVNLQRGKGVFEKSVYGLLKLNSVGYGVGGSHELNLVYNPIGPFLPPPQAALQEQYKKELWEDFKIQFNSLFTITNMPVKRYADFLHRRKELTKYMELLVNNFNPSAVDGLMCRDTLNIRWDGMMFDCDFNQQMDLGFFDKGRSIWDIESVKEMETVPINTEGHCYGCTAGAGSSCQGATM